MLREENKASVLGMREWELKCSLSYHFTALEGQ